jgi:hypothetical protein
MPFPMLKGNKMEMEPEGIKISDQDYQIMIDAAKNIYGNNEIAIAKSIHSQIAYANLVSNL